MVLYRAKLGNLDSVALGGDPSGRYWILAGHSNGWFRKGRLHVLAPPGGSAIADAW